MAKSTRAAAPTRPAASTPKASLKVRARRLGYYGEQRRRVGDVFTLRAQRDFSGKWMEPVDARTPERSTTPAEALAQESGAIIKRGKQLPPLPAVEDGDETAPTGALDVLGDE